MRTTLTLDDDVAAALGRLRQVRGARLKTLVNEVLRAGLNQMRVRPTRGAPFRTQSVDLGRPRLGSPDNVADALAIAESDAFPGARLVRGAQPGRDVGRGSLHLRREVGQALRVDAHGRA